MALLSSLFILFILYQSFTLELIFTSHYWTIKMKHFCLGKIVVFRLDWKLEVNDYFVAGQA